MSAAWNLLQQGHAANAASVPISIYLEPKETTVETNYRSEIELANELFEQKQYRDCIRPLIEALAELEEDCLLYTSPSPRD